jgi:hypothetical protein
MYRVPETNRAKTLHVKPFGKVHAANKLASFFAAAPHAA